MTDVFVSYARSDKALVAPLVAAIEASGWSAWWDPDIAPGQQFDDQITAELTKAVVWTPASVTSRWVRGEAREAADCGVPVPARLDGARLPLDVRWAQLGRCNTSLLSLGGVICAASVVRNELSFGLGRERVSIFRRS